MNSSTPRTCRRAGAATVAWVSMSNKPAGTGTPNSRSACFDERPGRVRRSTGPTGRDGARPGYQTRAGIARGPPVLGSVRAGSSTNVERTPTGWRPVGRGIDSPTPPEDTQTARPAQSPRACPCRARARHPPRRLRQRRSQVRTSKPPSELSSCGACGPSWRSPSDRSPPAEPPHPRRWHRPGVPPTLRRRCLDVK